MLTVTEFYSAFLLDYQQDRNIKKIWGYALGQISNCSYGSKERKLVLESSYYIYPYRY